MISVVIPLYNKEISISNTLNSLLKQRFNDFEILVINDGSTDSSVSIVEKYNDKRIRIVHKENGGVSSARNLGIREAKYDWICFLDADDNWKVDHLFNIVDVIKNKETEGFIATAFIQSFENINQSKLFSAKTSGLQSLFDVAAYNGFPVHTSAVCIHKNILSQFYFNENLTLGEDNQLFVTIGKRFKVYFITVPTSIYSGDTENKETRKTHPIENDFLYQLDFSDQSITTNERKYYIIFIGYHLFKYLKEKNINKFYTLLMHYAKWLKLSDLSTLTNLLLKK